MVKQFSVSQNHKDYVNQAASDVINKLLSPSVVVNYSIESGSEFKKIGSTGKGFSLTTQGLLRTSYAFTYPSLCLEDLRQLRNLDHNNYNSAGLLVFNDPSDNYVFNYGENEVQQYGVFRSLGGNLYRGFKVYRAGKKKVFYPIYYFDDSSEIMINGQDLDTYTVTTCDRETGIFTSTVDLTAFSFETDLYYKLVRVKAPLQIRHISASGLIEGMPSLSNVDLPDKHQRWEVSVQLENVYLTEDIRDVATKIDDAQNNIPFLDLINYQNDLKISAEYNNSVLKLGSNEFYKNVSGGNTSYLNIEIPSREQELKELNYWKTMYLACSGGSFFVNQVSS
jgi:hypothetical protein